MASTHSLENARTIVYVTCTNCRQTYVLPREAAGQRKRCKVCEGLIQIPWECFYTEGDEIVPSQSPTVLQDRPLRFSKSRIAKRLVLSFEQKNERPFEPLSTMHSTKGEVIRRKLLRLFTSPHILLSTVLAGLFVWRFMNGDWSTWDSIAASILALGLGVTVYRFTAGKKHTAFAREELRKIGKRSEVAKLIQIKSTISRSHESQLTNFLERLDSAFTRLQQVDRWRCNGNTMKSLEIAEIHDQTCRLYLSCRNMLEQSQELLNGASQMATDAARARVMKSRGALLAELQTSLEHLEHVLDEVFASQLPGRSQPIIDASELRDELIRRVEVARQIEERLEQFAKRK